MTTNLIEEGCDSGVLNAFARECAFEAVETPVPRKLVHSSYFVWKYPIERCIGCALLVVFAPLIGMLWLVVAATSKGGGFYLQSRVGLDRRIFKLVKLRSMKSDAELNGRVQWCSKRDARVTRLGRVLRALHLDELPQLWNVACGDMTLIGPRPERPEITEALEDMIPGYNRRHSVKPGITGLAQVNLEPDRNINMTRKKQILDLRYIERANFFLDLRMALATALRMVGMKGQQVISLLKLQQTFSKSELASIGYDFSTPEDELWTPAKLSEDKHLLNPCRKPRAQSFVKPR